jgi:hypothetical protein
MNATVKRVDALSSADLELNPVWQYVNRDEAGEILVRPVKQVPVSSVSGKLIGTRVRLANGTEPWALIGNVSDNNPRMTEHFVTMSIERDGKWFHLARYHDMDYAERGPNALAQFLGLSVDDLFPITFDLRRYAKGDDAALTGTVRKEPREKLSRAELIGMAVP